MTNIDQLGKKYYVRDTETDENIIDITVINASDIYKHLGICDVELTEVVSYVRLVKQRVEETGLELGDIYWHSTTSSSYDIWDVVGVCYDNDISTAIIEFRDDIE